MLTHLMANRKGLFPPLEPAILWAKRKHLRQLRASLLLCAAENYAVLGQTPAGRGHARRGPRDHRPAEDGRRLRSAPG